MKLRPLGNRILVERESAVEKTAGGILVPETAQTKPYRGKVIAVGPGKLRDDGTYTKMHVQKGDVVAFSRYAGNDLQDMLKCKDSLLIMTEDEIFGVLEE